jgi:cyanophycinase
VRTLVVTLALVALAAPARADGALVIHGGGTLPRAVADRFAALAGGADGHLVIIPTASGAESTSQAAWARREFASVEVLHTAARDVADTDAFAAPLARATAVWIEGGEQSRLERAYGGTRVEAALHALLARGGVIGGTSAGAAIMSRVMIRGGKTRPRMGTGFGLLPGAIVDQHFVARARQPRLERALARHPGLVGYGVDEATAMVVTGGAFTVVGDSTVTVCIAGGARARRAVTCTPHAAGATVELAD